jgi:hypothetical protein
METLVDLETYFKAVLIWGQPFKDEISDCIDVTVCITNYSSRGRATDTNTHIFKGDESIPSLLEMLKNVAGDEIKEDEIKEDADPDQRIESERLDCWNLIRAVEKYQR